MNVLAVLSPTPDAVLAAAHEYVQRYSGYPTCRDIAARHSWPVVDVSAKLSLLAIRGRVERLPGGAYRPKGAFALVAPMQAAVRKEPAATPAPATSPVRDCDVEPRRYTAVDWPPDEQFMDIVDREYARPKKGAIRRLATLFQCTEGAVQNRINSVYRMRGRDRPTRFGLAPVRVDTPSYRRTNTHYGPDAEFAAAAEQAYREHDDPLQVLKERYGAPTKKAVGKQVTVVFERLGRQRPYINPNGQRARGTDGQGSAPEKPGTAHQGA